MRRIHLAALLLLLLGEGSTCTSRPSASAMVLITLDTTRADRLGCYGYTQGKTPRLDALAGEGLRFTQAMAPVPVTLPSHTSMFTGLYPAAHGVRYNGMFHVAPETTTVAEILQGAGWSTAAIPAAYPVTASTGLAQGFQVYRDLFQEADQAGRRLPLNAERKAKDVTDLAIAWLKERKPGEKFFLWVHYFDPHHPYAPPFPESAQFRDRPYDGEIASVDREAGRLLDALGDAGRYDDALIVVAGDHGEGLYEHGEKMHSNLAYQSTLHVPLLLKPPGGASGAVVEDPVSLVDVASTLLDYAGAEVPPMDGVSLKPLASGERPAAREVYFESLAGSLLYGWSPLEGVRRGRFKYIRSSAPELYDLEADPGELSNLYGTDRDVALDLDADLASRFAGWEKSGVARVAPTPLEPSALERLASLGYVGGAVSSQRRGGRNPSEVVQVETAVLLARDQMKARQWREALATWKSILAADPGNRHVLHQAIYTALHLDDVPLAFSYAEDLLRRYPEFLPGEIALGEIWVRKKDPVRAAEVFRASLGKHPGDPALVYRFSLALLMADQVEAAEAEVEKVLAGRKDLPSFLVVRALCRARRADPAGALHALREAIAKGYRNRETLETEPMLSPLRALPGFQDVLATIPEPGPAPAEPTPRPGGSPA